MSFLYFLEDIRTPVCDWFFSAITNLGDETIFIVAGLLVFWCIDKRQGYYLLSVGFAATAISQFLKIFCRIPRPWVLDKDFTVVGNAKVSAGGYSFPSGHSSASVGLYGSFARYNKNNVVRAVCIAICILVPFSRMYLGVHTPQDILVGSAISVVLLFAVYPLIKKSEHNPYIIPCILGVLALMSAGLLLYVGLYNFPADVDAKNLAAATKNGWTLLGAVIGLILAYFIDIKYVNFKTEAPLPAQILKAVLGAAIALAIKSVLKSPLLSLFGNHPSAHAVRYFAVVIFAGIIWPLTFKFFANLFKKKTV